LTAPLRRLMLRHGSQIAGASVRGRRAGKESEMFAAAVAAASASRLRRIARS